MTRFHLVQSDLVWENIDANLEQLTRQILDINTGVIVLPEMFSTGFSMASEKLAEEMSGKAVSWMLEQARSKRVSICGSLIISAGGHVFNRFIWVSPDGQFEVYDKRHLFRMSDEHQHYSAGKQLIQVSVDDMQIRPQVCYDLRFPAWSRNTTGYDALIYVANWPAARRNQWLSLLQARAIENLAYVIGVNRVGTDGNGVEYSGDSCVVDPTGKYLLQMGAEEAIGAIDLDLEPLREYRQSFPAHLDADQFDLSI